MKKKIIFRGPVQTASGYGVHARMLLKALDEDGRFDVTVMSVPWGATPLIYDDTPEMLRIKELASKFNPNVPPDFDASVQVTIPNEFMKMAPKNICVTAGIETDRVSPVWHQRTNDVADVLVVPSVHSARSFTTAIYGEQKGPQQLLLRKPLYILPEWVDTSVFNTAPSQSSIDLSDMPDFNYLVVGLGMDKPDGEDRKNITNTLKWFCEQFKNDPNIGMVMKVSMVGASPVDYKNVKDRIQWIKHQAGCGQFPKIKLIHGRLSDLELAALYKHPKVKALVSLTHGEGYGLPIIEAAACGLPVMATAWSGHLDFLNINGSNRYVPVEFDLAPIPASCVWKEVLEEGTRWANPKENDAKMKMAKLFISYDVPKQWATELAGHIASNFNEDIGKQWADDMFKLIDGEPVQLTKNFLVKTSPRTDIRLDNITLVALDTRPDPRASVMAMKKSAEQISFGSHLFITGQNSNVEQYLPDLPSGTTVVRVPEFSGVPDHDTYVMRSLPDLIETEFFMTIQDDGYVLNGSAWDDKFLEYDLIGAPWFWDGVVGNMALCIRSMKLARELQNAELYPDTAPQDINICRVYRNQLEEKGFKFAPAEVAARFSVENLPYQGQFGWHGQNPFYGER